MGGGEGGTGVGGAHAALEVGSAIAGRTDDIGWGPAPQPKGSAVWRPTTRLIAASPLGTGTGHSAMQEAAFFLACWTLVIADGALHLDALTAVADGEEAFDWRSRLVRYTQHGRCVATGSARLRAGWPHHGCPPPALQVPRHLFSTPSTSAYPAAPAPSPVLRECLPGQTSSAACAPPPNFRHCRGDESRDDDGNSLSMASAGDPSDGYRSTAAMRGICGVHEGTRILATAAAAAAAAAAPATATAPMGSWYDQYGRDEWDPPLLIRSQAAERGGSAINRSRAGTRTPRPHAQTQSLLDVAGAKVAAGARAGWSGQGRTFGRWGGTRGGTQGGTRGTILLEDSQRRRGRRHHLPHPS